MRNQINMLELTVGHLMEYHHIDAIVGDERERVWDFASPNADHGSRSRGAADQNAIRRGRVLQRHSAPHLNH